MKKVNISAICIFAFIFVAACSGAKGGSGPTPKELTLWEKTASPYLKGNLWVDRDAYDAGHYLMVPLHAAFHLEHDPWLLELADHVALFYPLNVDALTSGRLQGLQYIYFLSRFVVLATQNNRVELIPMGLPQWIFSQFKFFYKDSEAWHWTHDPFVGGIAERLEWKLGVVSVSRNFYRAITDEDFFTLAIGGDLASYAAMTGTTFQNPEILAEAYSQVKRVFEKRVVYIDGVRWLFEPGAWEDHRDFAYAGHADEIAGMDPLKRENVTRDSSHSLRLPLLLISYASYGEVEKDYFLELLKGLSSQLVTSVIVSPDETSDYYRLNNYMDGWNGLYRWNYRTAGEGNGYRPYELSVALFLGWHGFIGAEAEEIYSTIASSFPLSDGAIKTYLGPNTTRERNPYVELPAAFSNGYLELLSNLAIDCSQWSAAIIEQ